MPESPEHPVSPQLQALVDWVRERYDLPPRHDGPHVHWAANTIGEEREAQ